MTSTQRLAPNDWFEHPELLPPRPLGLTETKFTRRFAVDLHGSRCHDQYVFMSPNGLAVVGLAPSHPLVAAHRRATGYQPTQLRYIPPQLDHLKAEELVAAVPDEEGQEDAAAAGTSGGPGDAGEEAAAPQSRDDSGAGSAAAVDDAPADGAAPASASASAAQAGGEAAGGGGGAEAGGGAGSGRPEQRPAPECEPFPPEQCSRVNFESGSCRNLAGTKASGRKRGRGAQQLRGAAVLARVERRGGGASFPIRAVLNGQLLEVNERLVKTPSLLYDRPCREGYVAILMPTPEGAKHFESRLISEAEYLRLRGLTAEDLL